MWHAVYIRLWAKAFRLPQKVHSLAHVCRLHDQRVFFASEAECGMLSYKLVVKQSLKWRARGNLLVRVQC